MKLDDRLGAFAAGKEADFIVLDPASTPLLARRAAGASSLHDLLFALMILGDDRAVRETWVAGKLAHVRDAGSPVGEWRGAWMNKTI